MIPILLIPSAIKYVKTAGAAMYVKKIKKMIHTLMRKNILTKRELNNA